MNKLLMNENTKLDKVIEFLEEHISEVNDYANSDDYDELEKHDCRIAVEAYELVLSYAKDLRNLKII